VGFIRACTHANTHTQTQTHCLSLFRIIYIYIYIYIYIISLRAKTQALSVPLYLTCSLTAPRLTPQPLSSSSSPVLHQALSIADGPRGSDPADSIADGPRGSDPADSSTTGPEAPRQSRPRVQRSQEKLCPSHGPGSAAPMALAGSFPAALNQRQRCKGLSVAVSVLGGSRCRW
jgi:hypothetical protein